MASVDEPTEPKAAVWQRYRSEMAHAAATAVHVLQPRAPDDDFSEDVKLAWSAWKM